MLIVGIQILMQVFNLTKSNANCHWLGLDLVTRCTWLHFAALLSSIWVSVLYLTLRLYSSFKNASMWIRQKRFFHFALSTTISRRSMFVEHHQTDVEITSKIPYTGSSAFPGTPVSPRTESWPVIHLVCRSSHHWDEHRKGCRIGDDQSPVSRLSARLSLTRTG